MCKLAQPTLGRLLVAAMLATGPVTGAPQEVSAMTELAKRRPPAVAPVTLNGVRYEVPRAARTLGHGQASGILAAVSEASGELLWSVAVYPVSYGGAEEKDAQDVFITAIAAEADGAALLVTNETGARFRVRIADHGVEPLP